MQLPIPYSATKKIVFLFGTNYSKEFYTFAICNHSDGGWTFRHRTSRTQDFQNNSTPKKTIRHQLTIRYRIKFRTIRNRSIRYQADNLNCPLVSKHPIYCPIVQLSKKSWCQIVRFLSDQSLITLPPPLYPPDSPKIEGSSMRWRSS